MSPTYPQKPVFSAEVLLGRANGHALNGHAHEAAVPSGDIESLRAEIRTLGEKIDALAAGGGVAVAATASGLSAAVPAMDQTALDKVKAEVEAIAARITLTKQEIAALKHPLAKDDKLHSASMELSAVVKATEEATTAIMQVAEHLDEITREVTSHVSDSYVISRLNEMSEYVTKLYEACSFQDLTGQRITKVVKTIDYIEQRIETMQVIWGKKDIEKLPIPEDEITKKDGTLELHGPQAANEAISQDDIDKLFD